MCLHASDCTSGVCTNNVCIGIADLSAAADLSMSGDLSAPGDQSMPSEAGTSPDLLGPLDLTPGPDLSGPCPLRNDGEWHVSPSGTDTTSLSAGNGSAQCPLKTINNAHTRALNDGFSPTTIFVHAAPGVTPTVYGDNCTGGSPCDVNLTFSVLVGQSITLQGDSAASVLFATSQSGPSSNAAIWIVGGDTSSSVTVAGLTVQSLFLGQSPSQGQGIEVGNPGGGPALSVTVRDAVIKGTPSSSTMAGVGFCITGPSTLTIGPGVTIDGCTDGVGTFGPIIGTATEPTVLKNSGEACVSNAGAVSGVVSAQNCLRYGVLASSVDGLVVTGGGNGLGEAIQAGIVKNSQVSGFAGVGIVGGMIGPNVQVMNVIGTGVHALGNSTIDGLVATTNQGDGILCDGSGVLSLTNTILTANAGNGVVIAGNCSVTKMSMTTFNKTSAKNGKAGICVLGGAATSVTADSSTFGCGYSGTGCVTTSSPTTATGATCQVADVSTASGFTVATTSASCCN
jgi:hypothetical protein